MTNRKKLLTLLALVPLLLLSCAKDTPAPDVPASTTDAQPQASENPNLLTNIFRGTPLTLPAGCTPMERVQPYYDSATQTLRVLCLYGDSTMILATLDADGNLLEERTLVKGEDPYPSKGVVTADAIFFQHTDYNADTMKYTYYVMRYDLADDTRTRSEDVAAMFEVEKSYFNVQNMTADKKGYVYLTSDNEIVVLDETLQYKFTIRTDAYVSSLVRDPDGLVYVKDRLMAGLCPIDRNSGMLGNALKLPDSYSIAQYAFGEGYDAYYSDEDGLHGYTIASAEDVLICNYANSDLYANNVDIAAILDPDRILLYGEDGTSLVLYKRSADVDLSDVTTLTIAHALDNSSLAGQIVEFNKKNPDIRVLTKNYAESGGDAERQLINDMLTGVYEPDIVLGWGMYDNVLAQMRENDLYVDLYQYIEKDEILASVRRMFESEDGKLTALPATINVSTYVASTSVVGNRVSWTLSDMLDLAENLPEGTRLIQGLSWQTASSAIFGNLGYTMFVDVENGTCDFENEDFLRYLAFLATLPETYNVANTRFEAEAAQANVTGETLLKQQFYTNVDIGQWIRNYEIFQGSEFTHIGYANREGEVGNAQVLGSPFAITTFCEDPDMAWAFIESVVDVPAGSNGIPVLKSRIMEVFEAEYGRYYEFYADGTKSILNTGGRNDPTAPMTKPGFRVVFDEAEGAKMLDWLENGIGLPAGEHMEQGLLDIIDEEISRYLGGMQTAEKCAEVLESRVGLWLAEHE